MEPFQLQGVLEEMVEQGAMAENMEGVKMVRMGEWEGEVD